MYALFDVIVGLTSDEIIYLTKFVHLCSKNFSGPSWITIEEFDAMWVAGAERQLSLRPSSPSPEEKMKRKQERYRKGLIIALNTYAKLNNMQACQSIS
jgi:hypothetical protein